MRETKIISSKWTRNKYTYKWLVSKLHQRKQIDNYEFNQEQDYTRIQRTQIKCISTKEKAVSVDSMTASAGVVWLATQTPPLRGFHCTLCVFMTAEIHNANTRKVTSDANSLIVLFSSLSGHTLKQNVQATAHETWKWNISEHHIFLCQRSPMLRLRTCLALFVIVCIQNRSNAYCHQESRRKRAQGIWTIWWFQWAQLTPKKHMRTRNGNKNAYRIQNPMNQITVIFQLMYS